MGGRRGAKVCFNFERTGRCKFGDTCRYAHGSGIHSEGPERDGDNNKRSGGSRAPDHVSSVSAAAFSATALRAQLVEQLQSGAISTSHSDALVALTSGKDRLDGLWQAFLTPKDPSRPWELNSQTQALNFINSGLHALHSDAWAPQFVRELGRPGGRGLALLQDLLDLKYSVDAGNQREVVSFQRGLVALVAMLTMSRVAMASRHVEEANGIFAFIRTARTQLFKTFCAQLTQIVERGNVEDRRLNSTEFLEACAGRKFAPLCFTQILLPFLRLLYMLGSKFSDLIYEETFSGTVYELDRLLTEWPATAPSVETLDTPLCIQLMKVEVERLIKMVRRGERSVQTVDILRDKARRAVAQCQRDDNSAASWDVMDVYVPAHALLENGTIGPRHNNDHMNIRDIRLLPTTEECLSNVEPPLPGNFPFHPNAHWLDPGPERWIDTHFRLLREDLCGSLRTSLQDLAYRLTDLDGRVVGGRLRSADVDYSVYPVVDMEMQLLHTENTQWTDDRHGRRPVRHGLTFDVAFHHPPASAMRGGGKQGDANMARRMFWDKTKRLSFQQMVALVSFSDGTLEIIFCRIVEREMDRLVQDISEITVQPFETADLPTLERWQCAAREKQQQSNMLLVEFNKTFFIGYEPVLRTLQSLVPDSMPFLTYLAPEEPIEEAQATMEAPMYCLKPGFRFDLSSALAVKSAHSPRRTVHQGQLLLNPLDTASCQQCETTLVNDSALERDQAKAIIHALSSRVACIQGLPGSGKSFIGTLLTRIIVEAQVAPVLVVCYTNHALDQFLCHLLDAGITRLVRVGGQCKEPRLERFNINQIPKQAQRFELRKLYIKLDERAEHVKEALDAAASIAPAQVTWTSLAYFLQTNYPDHYDYFQELSDEQLGGDWKVVGCTDILEYWLKGLDGVSRSSEHHLEVSQLLENPNVWEWGWRERRIGLAEWINEMKVDKVRALVKAQKAYQNTLKRLACVRDLADVKILSNAQIIGMTTTGVAKHHAKIAEVAPRVVVCEEAGEVLEAQLMACLAPSCQQLILIGDHQQLRPHIADYNLSVESHVGKRFALDMSLFERLVSQRSGIPWCTLTEQHRMRPEISQLVRMLFYPNVRDAHETTLYPPLRGVDKNVFFVTHGKPEDGMDSLDATGGLRSHSNAYEVAYVVATLHYLLKQGYHTGDIAILTPYVSQLLKLRSALQGQFVLEFNELDLEEIQRTVDNDGDKDGGDAGKRLLSDLSASRSMPLGVSKMNLAGAIRIATVDNFQGEEADVILVSLVRSRSSRGASQRAGTIGFLKIPNRVNVLLSRAKHGMILVGDGTLLRGKSPMWQQVVSRLESEGCYGEGLPLCCQKHPDYRRVATSPEAFSQIAPDGGCLRPCGERLPRCGHTCPKLCHTDQPYHTTVFCSQPCPRLQEGCEHVCPRLCGEECGDCKEDVGTIQLPCGHEHHNTMCFQAKTPEKILCRVMCDKVVPACGHTRRVACNTKTVVCTQVCGAALPCGHSCLRTCDECTKKTTVELTNQDNDATRVLPIVPTKHGSCQKKCGRTLACSHHCRGICHGTAACPPCDEVCDIFRCDHGACTHACNKSCAACTMTCEWSCEHRGQCPLPCGAPCTRQLCDKRCELPLECGHQCPSVCGERCPDTDFCHECASEDVKARVADLVMFQPYGEIDPTEDPVLVLDCCSAVYTMSTLDGTLQLSDFYDTSGLPRGPLPGEYMAMPQCPNCKRPIRGLRRYGRLTKRAAVDAAEKKFITEAQRRLAQLQMQVNAASEVEDACEDAKLHRELRDFGNAVKKPPCRKVYDACVAQLTKQAHGKPIDKSMLPVPNSRFPYRGYYYMLAGQLSLARTGPKAAQRALSLAHESVRHFGQGNFPQQLREAQLLLAQALSVSAERKLDETANSEKERGEREQAISTLVDEEMKLLLTLEAGPQSFQTQHWEDVRALKTRMEIVLKRARDVSFYQELTNAELRVIKIAMQSEFMGSGHWYRCANGHSYSIGECGMPMEQTRCPECDAPVGGTSHTPVQGTTQDNVMESLN